MPQQLKYDSKIDFTRNFSRGSTLRQMNDNQSVISEIENHPILEPDKISDVHPGTSNKYRFSPSSSMVNTRLKEKLRVNEDVTHAISRDIHQHDIQFNNSGFMCVYYCCRLTHQIIHEYIYRNATVSRQVTRTKISNNGQSYKQN